MKLISQLIDEHRTIAGYAAQLLDVVAAEVPDAAAVAALRWRAARALIDHCEREDRELYGMLLASGDLDATGLAWRFRQEHGALHEDVRRYISEWPVGRIAAEWTGFRAETRALIAALQLRVDREEAILYPLALRLAQGRSASAACATPAVPAACLHRPEPGPTLTAG